MKLRTLLIACATFLAGIAIYPKLHEPKHTSVSAQQIETAIRHEYASYVKGLHR